jgi:hypothetical protein
MTQERPKLGIALDNARALSGNPSANFAALARLLARHAARVSSGQPSAVRTDPTLHGELPLADPSTTEQPV